MTPRNDIEFTEPLRRLLHACAAPEADLSLVGRAATRWDVVRFLSNLLRFQAEETRHPDIAAQHRRSTRHRITRARERFFTSSPVLAKPYPLEDLAKPYPLEDTRHATSE